MAHKIDPNTPLDDLEREVLFTAAAVQADPDAADLADLTKDWMPAIDAVRIQGRELRTAEALAVARRVVANGRLDDACVRFGDELFLAAGKDRTTAAWTRYFPIAVSRFVTQALPKQVALVRGWLSAGAGDAVLERHRVGLDQWSGSAAVALEDSAAVGARRGGFWQAREELADHLTRERDSLYDALRQRAREKGLPRDWSDRFFRIESGTAGTPPAPELPANPS